MKKILNVLAIVVVVIFAGYNVYKAQQPVVLSDIAMAHVEALADYEFVSRCPNCKVCEGSYIICESHFNQWLEDAQNNCSALEIYLQILSGC